VKNVVSEKINVNPTHEEKAAVIDEYFECVLGNCTRREYTINLAELGINAHDLSDLELPFTEEEVWMTIKQLPSDKAPGPDRYTGRFYKTCWAIIKEDIMAAISAVWSRKLANFGVLNSAYITLLPKKEGAEQPKDFRPISLVHSSAKLIKKKGQTQCQRLPHEWGLGKGITKAKSHPPQKFCRETASNPGPGDSAS
jgi:hypothetical protein